MRQDAISSLRERRRALRNLHEGLAGTAHWCRHLYVSAIWEDAMKAEAEAAGG